MRKGALRSRVAWSCSASVLLGSGLGFAQGPAGAPAPEPAPAPQPPPPQYAAPAPQPPPPQYAAPAPPPTYGAYPEPPPPPLPPENEGFEFPGVSVRVDPLNWILLGRLGFELEVGLLDWLSLETVPVFIATQSPPWLNYGSNVDVTQHSNGWGPLAGASLGANFWLNGKAFQGYAVGVGFTNYALEYRTDVDSTTHTERQLYAMFSSVSRWGAFTIAGGIGFAYDLNNQSRCFEDGARSVNDAVDGDCNEIQLATKDPVNLGPIVIVTPYTYPWEILARFSLGVTFD